MIDRVGNNWRTNDDIPGNQREIESHKLAKLIFANLPDPIKQALWPLYLNTVYLYYSIIII